MLPNYYYRDDAIKVWNSLESFVGEVINQYYKSDIDVVNDSELQVYFYFFIFCYFKILFNILIFIFTNLSFFCFFI